MENLTNIAVHGGNGISIVIPTHGRAALVERLLKSLERAKRSPDVPIEVIVVDSSAEANGGRIRELCQQHAGRYLRGSVSVRKKRNSGVAGSQYGWILFVDSDCEVSDDLLWRYSAFIRSAGERLEAAAGPTRFRGAKSWLSNIVVRSSLLQPFRNPEVSGCLLWAPTSNFLICKRSFEELGGFREDFPFRLGGDDTDLCLRLHETGSTIHAVPEAVCYHSWETWSSPFPIMRRSFRWGWMHAILLLRHPTFRRLDWPGLPVYTLICCALSLIGLLFGRPFTLLGVPLFLILALLGHAVAAGVSSKRPVRTFVEDLVLATVECPFGFGRTIGSLAHGSLMGVVYRLDRDDRAMDDHFSNVVRDLWSNNIALLVMVSLMVLVGG